MRPAFRVVAGSRAGFTFTPAGDSFLAGRREDAELRFDPHHDRAVSGHHAEFYLRDSTWHVKDLDSRNGTWLNGARVHEPTALADGDTVAFGADGPAVEFRARSVAAGLRESTTQRLRAAVRLETRRLRIGAAVLIAAVSLTAALLVAAERRNRSAGDPVRQALQARVDSLLAAGRATNASLDAEMNGLRDALRESNARLQQLRTRLAAGSDNGDDVAELQRQLLSASAALRRQQLAAGLDFATIEQRNRSAVAMLWVEYDDGSIVTGTAFAVRGDGTLITNRHLVAGRDGTRTATRIAVRFADSGQTFPARLRTVSRDWDLAALQVENVLGSVPTAAPPVDTGPLAGAPVALIGFPLAGEQDRENASGIVARPLVSAGVVMGTGGGVLEIQGLGAAGGSGSPVLDGAGNVAGVLYGGRRDTDVQVLLAVPAAALARFLASLD
jgi:hypothetical protein